MLYLVFLGGADNGSKPQPVLVFIELNSLYYGAVVAQIVRVQTPRQVPSLRTTKQPQLGP